MQREYNRTSRFLLPLVGLRFNVLVSTDSGFIGAYLDDYSKPEISFANCLAVVFEFKNNEQSDLFYSSLRSKDSYLTEYDMGENIIFVFKINPKFENVKNLFIQGKYSKFPQEYTSTAFAGDFDRIVDGDGRIYHTPTYPELVCAKHESLRAYWEERLGVTLPDGAEVCSIPDPKQEILNYKE